MNNAIRLPAFTNIDPVSECLLKFTNSENDTTIYHSHSFYEVFLTVSGNVTHYINGVSDVLPEGTLVFIRPDDTHTYIYDENNSQNSTYVNLAFSQNVAEQVFAFLSDTYPSKDLLTCKMPPKKTLSIMEKGHLLRILEEVNSAGQRDKNFQNHRLKAVLTEIFTKYFSGHSKSAESNFPLWFSQLLLEMEKVGNFNAGIDKMVELSGKSREHIARTFKKYLNISSTEYINERRINYAINLIISQNMPILDVCFNCGFQSVSHFYKVFKKIYGISPLELKKTWLDSGEEKIFHQNFSKPQQKGLED